MRFAFAAVVLGVLLGMSGMALAENNDCVTVVLHAASGIDTDCQTDVDCTAVQPTTRIDGPVGLYTVVMYLRNYDEVNGVQVAFDWPGTWSFGFGLWNCQTGQLSAVTPTAPGPLSGSITTAFNFITGGALAPVGVMVFNSLGVDGCLSIIESEYPFGNHVINGNVTPPETAIRDENEGKICVAADGLNACECVPEAVEPATWGQIKATYR